MFEVGDPVRNAVLTICFVAIATLAVAAVVPWKALGVPRLGSLTRWSFAPAILFALAYESAMPSRFDIRLDLFVLLPMLGVVLLASVVRWIVRWSGSRHD